MLYSEDEVRIRQIVQEEICKSHIPNRQGEYWSPKEDQDLLNQRRFYTTVSLAYMFNRSELAIVWRLKKLLNKEV
jgi:hypothetical protein